MSKPERDYSETLFLPQTEFPMRAGLPQREPEILARWEKADLYRQLRDTAKGRDKFILHDGPPYANGNIHIGHALNKILKDVVTRSQQMLGFDSNYVPGWDCHGLPIEWKIEEENYRSKNKTKPNLSDPAAMVAFRQECRAYAEHWLNVQREEFKRLGVEGDWAHPYTTMDFFAEAQIARELMKFAANGTLYRGSKPVMWSVVEKTALAEAEVEYEDYTSDQVWVKFPVANVDLESAADRDATALAFNLIDWGASVVIWTTTPWTLPGNRAISFSPKIEYGVYRVTDAPADNWAKVGDVLILADKLAADVFKQARVAGYEKIQDMPIEHSRRDDLYSSAFAKGLQLCCSVACWRPRHRRCWHRLRAHGARPWPRGFRGLDSNRAFLEDARHQSERSPIPSTKMVRSPRQHPALPASASSTTRVKRAMPTRQ